jgi:hypothetical protein
MNETETITEPAAPRKRDALARCVNDLLSANAHGPGNLNAPALRRLLEFPSFLRCAATQKRPRRWAHFPPSPYSS